MAIRLVFESGFSDLELQVPDLLDCHTGSFALLFDKNDSERSNLDSILSSAFPIRDPAGKLSLEYLGYVLEPPRYTESECRLRGASYASVMRMSMRLIVWEASDKDKSQRESVATTPRACEERDQIVYVGEIPIMTESGTFIINGTDHVVVSQMHLSPGVLFSGGEAADRTSSNNPFAALARIVPYRGVWLDLVIDIRGFVLARIDRKKKVYATTLLIACGIPRSEIAEKFHPKINLTRNEKDSWTYNGDYTVFATSKSSMSLLDENGEILVRLGNKMSNKVLQRLQSSGERILLEEGGIIGLFLASDVWVDSELIAAQGEAISSEIENRFKLLNVNSVDVYLLFHGEGPWIINTLKADKSFSQSDALKDIYSALRPGESAGLEVMQSLLRSLYFDSSRYDLSKVGRIKLNMSLGFSFSEHNSTVLTIHDLVAVIGALFHVASGAKKPDDIDHLGNRRVKSAGELVANQFRIAVSRMARATADRMPSVDIETVMPYDIMNTRLFMGVIKEFFMISQLSQFMDQTNPLSSLTHKRRLSALGPGGLNQERAGFEVRDVHHTHYGRVCPVETPEGQNIGLINSLALYARINQYGFIETPYHKVSNRVVSREVVYFNAIEEAGHKICGAKVKLDLDCRIVPDVVECRYCGEYIMVPSEEIDAIDVSQRQIVSVAAAMIPFLEMDDANRALMGSNMQRQAVPLLLPKAPYIGTGMEKVVASSSRACITAKRSGIVSWADSKRVVVTVDDCPTEKIEQISSMIDVYTLEKFSRTNFSTCNHNRPAVRVNQRVEVGDVIADGSATDGGELALGANVRVGFLSWRGQNFEDAIAISERLIRDDVYTSIHIEEFECIARDTRLGPEEITRDVPQLSEESLANIGETGIILVGSTVKSGDILVGKITPREEVPLTPEEKLLRAVFGESSMDVIDSSLYASPGISGVVVDVRVLCRRGLEKDGAAMLSCKSEIDAINENNLLIKSVIREVLRNKILAIAAGKNVKTIAGEAVFEDAIVSEKFLLSLGESLSFTTDDELINDSLFNIKKVYSDCCNKTDKEAETLINNALTGLDLSTGVLKVVRVYVATKNKLQAGDKMSGRHGNKGVISKVVPIEDMPYMEDGTPVDVLLSPLGVPSRMNIGQILEVHSGMASVCLASKIADICKKANDDWMDQIMMMLESFGVSKFSISKLKSLGVDKFKKMVLDDSFSGIGLAMPVFDGLKDDKIADLLEGSGFNRTGQVYLYDGVTGERFDRPVTVGFAYMLKLHHLVDGKIHARSVGPYSLITQQPLGGRAQFGGQRLGEMEVWALEAYGAAMTLQEMITVKSDDVKGRVMMYESIVRGHGVLVCGVPESFNVLVRELQALCLNIEFASIEGE